MIRYKVSTIFGPFSAHFKFIYYEIVILILLEYRNCTTEIGSEKEEWIQNQPTYNSS